MVGSMICPRLPQPLALSSLSHNLTYEIVVQMTRNVKRKWERRRSDQKFDCSIDVFLRVWEHLEKMCKDAERFALVWLLRDDKRLKLFVDSILGLHIGQFSKGLLYNGYVNCKAIDLPILSPQVWSRVDSIFDSHLSRICLLPRLKLYISYLPASDLMHLLEKRITEWEVERDNKTFSYVEKLVETIDCSVLDECKHCFLGEWDDRVLDRFHPSVHNIFKAFPQDYIVMERNHNYVAFYDRSGEVPVLVAVHVSRNDQLSPKSELWIRKLLEDLFAAHRKIVRATASFEGDMVGHGPLHNCYKKGKDIVSFYTSLLKIKDLVGCCSSAEAFQELIDRHAATDLMEILLGLYFWWCPSLLKEFFNYSTPYMKYPQCPNIDLEKTLGMNGPPAYQLYVTKDYCSEMHCDRDATDLTLCYVSHPDSSNSPVDFVIGPYGICLPLENRDLMSENAHATGYTAATQNAAYVGCVAVNSRLRNLMARRSQ